MHLLRVAILILTLTLPIFATAQDEQHSKAEIDLVLSQLDGAINQKMRYQAEREERADSIENVLANFTPDQKEYVNTCKELFYAVNDYDGRRSIATLRLIEDSECYKNDTELQAWVKLSFSEIYGTMGLYHKSSKSLQSVNPKTLSREERLHYYYACRAFYERVAEYISSEDVADDEEKRMMTYYDSITALQTDPVSRDLMVATRNLYTGNNEEALKAALHAYHSSEKGTKAYVYSCMTLADVYRSMGDATSSIYYLAITATEDIKSGTTEYQSLPYLVQALYDKGDIERAYKYLVCAMEDANFYPARNLAVKVSSYYPLVNQAYSSQISYMVNSEKMKQNSLTVTYVFLAIAIIVTLLLGLRYNSTKNERRRANELQKALDKASIADRIKTVFIQNMRHEIRTPLNAIMGFAQLMSNDLSAEERELYNSYIQESNDQLLHTLDNIIDVSNMEVGVFNFKYTDVDIDKLCHAKIEDVSELLPANVQIQYNPSQQGLHLRTDVTRVGQVLYNLLSNACKNTTEGIIRLSVINSISTDSIQFAVSDTGTGVPKDKSKVIFQHFEKLDHYSPGLGLGLYVCRLIVRALGGDIYLDTSYSGGARFVFNVPNKS